MHRFPRAYLGDLAGPDDLLIVTPAYMLLDSSERKNGITDTVNSLRLNRPTLLSYLSLFFTPPVGRRGGEKKRRKQVLEIKREQVIE